MEHEIILVISLLASSGAAFGLSLLLVLEQQQSLRPSDLAILYLVPSIICDVLLLTMPSKIQAVSRASHPILARCLIHSTLLVFEICDNIQLVDKQLPPALQTIITRKTIIEFHLLKLPHRS